MSSDPNQPLPSQLASTQPVTSGGQTVTPDASSSASQGTPQSINSDMEGQVANPALSPNQTLTPVLQQVQTPELMNGQNSQLNPTANNAAQSSPVKANTIQQTQAQATTVNPNGIPMPTAQTYQASNAAAAQGTAAQMQVNPLDTVSGQLTNLYSQSQIGTIPTWAQGAVAAANDAMAQRGMGSSSVGVAAIAAAMQNSALNIASADATTYFNTNMANFNATTQQNLQNVQNVQQSLLSNQSAQNAAAQFNATSTDQTQQFVASLVTGIATQNANMMTAISQFNAGQANTIASTNAQNTLQAGEFNTQQQNAIDTFNSAQDASIAQFNAQNAFAVEQSNVTWQRTVNTANTAAVNAANQTKVQNAYNLSTNSLNNLWNQFLDESSWIFQAGQNQNIINANATMAANDENFILTQQANNQDVAFLSQIGSFAGSLLIGGSGH